MLRICLIRSLIRKALKKKTTHNYKCSWVVVRAKEYVRDRTPITLFDIKLVKGTYMCWERNEIINEGGVICRTNRALKKIMVQIEEA